MCEFIQNEDGDIVDRKDWTVAKVAEFPPCDFCGQPAKYDGPTKPTRIWGFMCQTDWTLYGYGKLGAGLGQRLELEV